MIPVWVFFTMLVVMVFVAIGAAMVWGHQRQERALGNSEYMKPVHDLTLRPFGPRRTFFVETFHDGRISFPAQQGKHHIVKNTGIFGLIGGETTVIDPDEMIEADGIYFYGKTQFLKLFDLKQVVLQNEVDHWKQQASYYQHLAEQRRHDPQYGVDQALENLQQVAKASQMVMPMKSSSKSGGKR